MLLQITLATIAGLITSKVPLVYVPALLLEIITRNVQYTSRVQVGISESTWLAAQRIGAII